MIEVPLTQGRVALIDDADFPIVSAYRWKFLKRSCGHGGYAIASEMRDGKKRMLSMHRVLLTPPAHLQVDHVNGDGLDNRRSNIRICTMAQNAANRASYHGGWKGAAPLPSGKFVARLTADNGVYSTNPVATKEQAARLYDALAVARNGEFARLNFPGEPLVPLGEIYYTCWQLHRVPQIPGAVRRMSRVDIWASRSKQYRKRRLHEKAAKRRALARAHRLAEKATTLTTFSKRDRQIIASRMFGATLETCGKPYGLTRERVRQIVQAAMPLLLAA